MNRSFLLLFLMMLSHSAFGAGPKAVRVALIFDDGPIAGTTEQLLQILASEKVHVTFGSVAHNAAANPDTVAAVVKAGHEIANHSLSHEHPAPLSDEKLEEQVVGAQRIFTETLHVKPLWYWPPFIEIEPRVTANAKKAGITVYPFVKIVASGDYMTEVSAEEIRKRATTGIEDGTVILFHEWRKESAEQLPAILDDLRKQGCEFLTFTELAAALGKGN